MRIIITFFLFFCISAKAQFTVPQKALSSLANILSNPGAEQGKTWVVVTDTYSITTTAANVGSGTSAFSWNSAGATRTLTSPAVTIPKGLYGHSGVASCNIQTPSGTATHTLEAYDGSATIGTAITVTSSTTYTRTSTVPFTIPSSGTIALRLKSVNANEPQIYIDDCIIGDSQLMNILPMPTPVAAWWAEAMILSTDSSPISLGLVSITDWVGITYSELEMTPTTGSAAVGIMCSSTNAATAPSSSATTCAAGDESVGVNFTIPSAGSYEVCLTSGMRWTGPQSSTVLDTFEIVETATNSQTIITHGVGTNLIGGTNISAVGTNGTQYIPMHTCSIFTWATTGTKAVRLFYQEYASGSPTVHYMGAAAEDVVGRQATVWRITPLSSNNYYSTTVLGSSGGAGGGVAVNWLATGGNSPTSSVYTSSDVYLFDAALAQELYTTVKVPTNYTAGLPIKLKLMYTTPDTSGNVLFTSVATLLAKDVTAFTGTTNQRTSTNAAATVSGTANANTEVSLDLTSTTGTINSVAVAAGDIINVKLTRGTDTATSQVRLHVNAYEVTLQ